MAVADDRPFCEDHQLATATIIFNEDMCKTFLQC